MHRDLKGYYGILGVELRATDDELRTAFRRRAKELHPDAETGDAGAFILLKKAYEVLSIPRKRASYDRQSEPRRRPHAGQVVRAPALPDWHRPRRYRIGGMSVARFAAAFLFMGGLSVAAIEVILDSSGAPVGEIFKVHAEEPATAKSSPIVLPGDQAPADITADTRDLPSAPATDPAPAPDPR